MKIRIFPSLISSDILNLEQTIKDLDPYCDGFHIDIMDNHFVPNLTLGPLFANAIDKLSQHPSWLHLMVESPEKMISQFKLKKQSIISFHIEAVDIPRKIIEQIDKKGLIASIAIKPSTSLEHIYPYLEHVKHVLLMSVEPGFSGQPFIHESLERLRHLMTHRTYQKLDYSIGIDGGINNNNIHNCVDQGATDFGIASGIFGQPNRRAALEELYKNATHHSHQD